MDTEPYRRPAEAFPVWNYIAKALDSHGMTVEQLAMKLPGDWKVNLCGLELLQLGNPGIILDEETAQGLADVFGSSKALWLNLDESFRKWHATAN